MPRASEWEPERQFLIRQVRGEGSVLQSAFDWSFGVILPVACFYFDPIVFTSSDGSGLYSEYSTIVYILAVVAISGLVTWKLLGNNFKVVAGFLAILFYVSASASLFLGMALFQFSFFGMVFMLIGVLGFTPFLSAFVYFRNGLRATRFAGRV